MKRFKQIIGGCESDVHSKFPWMKSADITNAIVDISGSFLVWKDGIWERGIWECGLWEDGLWKDGVWKDGVWRYGTWKNGTWEGGKMWCNLLQEYVAVAQVNGKFNRVEPIAKIERKGSL